MRHVGYADRLEDAGIPVHELGSTSEANDAFMLLPPLVPDGAEERWRFRHCGFCLVLTAVLSTYTRCCSVFCPPSTQRFTDYASVRDADPPLPESLVEKSETLLLISPEHRYSLSTQLRFVQAGGVALVPVTAVTSAAGS